MVSAVIRDVDGCIFADQALTSLKLKAARPGKRYRFRQYGHDCTPMFSARSFSKVVLPEIEGDDSMLLAKGDVHAASSTSFTLAMAFRRPLGVRFTRALRNAVRRS